MITDKLRPFGTTIFAEMTQLAIQHEAINLSQGFPDFEGPSEIIEAAIAALRAGRNQYARSRGELDLVRAIAGDRRSRYGTDYDPESEVLVFSGATEGIASGLLGLLNPGDEVILFEPFYDSYPAVAAMVGATVRYVTLRFPDFALRASDLEEAVTERTRLIVLNTPHNPSGKVFTREELTVVAEVCRRHDLLVLADEVYEHLVFDEPGHIPISSLPGMRERTLTLSSAGKTYSFTGFKIGWGLGAKDIVDAAQSAHQFVTYATATPLQAAVAYAIEHLGEDYLEAFRRKYRKRRDFLVKALDEAGFTVSVPSGTYFVLASFDGLFDGDDRAFARHLIEEHGVAAIPPSAFYAGRPEEGKKLLRFAFCKRMATLEEAAVRLGGI